MGLFLALDVWLMYQQILASNWQSALKRAELGSPVLPAVGLGRETMGECLSFPLKARRMFALALPTVWCGLASKRSLFPWMSFRPQYSPWNPHPLEQSLKERLSATQSSLGTNSFTNGGKASICLQQLFKKDFKLGYDMPTSCFSPIFNKNGLYQGHLQQNDAGKTKIRKGRKVGSS